MGENKDDKSSIQNRGRGHFFKVGFSALAAIAISGCGRSLPGQYIDEITPSNDTPGTVDFVMPKSGDQSMMKSNDQSGIKNFDALCTDDIPDCVLPPYPSTISDIVVEQIAYAIDLDVVMTSSYKWGWKIKVQELCTDNNYLVTGENEPWAAGNDKTRLLTTRLDFGCMDPQVSWHREDALSSLVNSVSDLDYMRLSSNRICDLGIDDMSVPPKEQYVDSANKFGVSIDDLMQMTGCDADQMQMHRWLRGESDPFSITTIRPLDKKPGVYEIMLYRVGTDNSRTRVLTAHLDFSTGEMKRIDSASMLGGPYSKIYAWIPDTNGFEIKKYGVDTESQSMSLLYMPELLALTGQYW